MSLLSIASRCSGSVIVATSTTSAQPGTVMGCTDGRRVGEVDPVGVGRLQQLGLLVLGGRGQPEPARRHVEVAAVLAQPTLADVDDLLALEQRVHDRGPLLEGRSRRVGVAFVVEVVTRARITSA